MLLDSGQTVNKHGSSRLQQPMSTGDQGCWDHRVWGPSHFEKEVIVRGVINHRVRGAKSFERVVIVMGVIDHRPLLLQVCTSTF